MAGGRRARARATCLCPHRERSAARPTWAERRPYREELVIVLEPVPVHLPFLPWVWQPRSEVGGATSVTAVYR